MNHGNRLLSLFIQVQKHSFGYTIMNSWSCLLYISWCSLFVCSPSTDKLSGPIFLFSEHVLWWRFKEKERNNKDAGFLSSREMICTPLRLGCLARDLFPCLFCFLLSPLIFYSFPCLSFWHCHTGIADIYISLHLCLLFGLLLYVWVGSKGRQWWSFKCWKAQGPHCPQCFINLGQIYVHLIFENTSFPNSISKILDYIL